MGPVISEMSQPVGSIRYRPAARPTGAARETAARRDGMNARLVRFRWSTHSAADHLSGAGFAAHEDSESVSMSL
jgi:hypothetical protein